MSETLEAATETIAKLTRDKLLVQFEKPEAKPKPRLAPIQLERNPIDVSVGFPPIKHKSKDDLLKEELAKIETIADEVYGKVEPRQDTSALIDAIGNSHAYITAEENREKIPKEILGHIDFLFNVANCITLENITLHEVNNNLNTRIRDLAGHLITGDIQRATFRM